MGKREREELRMCRVCTYSIVELEKDIILDVFSFTLLLLANSHREIYSYFPIFIVDLGHVYK